MLNTLYRRLTAFLIVFTGAITVMFVLVMSVSHERYHTELVQKLNQALAGQLIADGRLDTVAVTPERVGEAENRLRELTRVNPNIDLYLLDAAGRIVAASVPAERIARSQVRLEPVLRFVGGSRDFPLRGDDPAGGGEKAVFSAAPLVGAGAASYLYVVLHDVDHAANIGHRSVVHDVRQSYALREAILLTAAGVAFSLLAGLALLKALTRPLNSLSRAMERFAASHFADPPEQQAPAGPGADDVTRIGHTFERMATRIHEQMDALRQADAELRHMFASISHDLRTPLASVQGYLETLLLKYETLPDEERRRYLEVAAAQAERLARLVTELFELAKLESPRARIASDSFNIGDLVQDVVQKFDLSARSAGVALGADIPARLPLVFANLELIERVLDNLIENALHHTPGGGQITVHLSQQADEVRIEVSDTGCGIAPEDLPHVFEPFFRGRNAGSEGAGLGLAIVKRILELHRSKIQVESSPEKGCTFAFALPAKPAGSNSRTRPDSQESVRAA